MTALQLSLVTQGPVLSAGLGADLVGLDATMRRDSLRRPMIPGSHIKGRVREALVELLATWRETDDVEAVEAQVGLVLGRPQAKDGTALRGMVIFDDLVEGSVAADGADVNTDGATLQTLSADDLRVTPTKAGLRADTRTHVAIDRHSGAARKGNLGFVEAGAQGQDRIWSGAIHIPAGCAGLSQQQVAQLVALGVRMVTAVGRNTQAGWGRVVACTITPPVDIQDVGKILEALDQARQPTAVQFAAKSAPAAVGDAHVDVCILLESPLMVADGSVTGNVYEGRTDIPGSVIRRGIADALLQAAGRRRGGWVSSDLEGALPQELRPLCEAFPQLHSTFAFAPAPDIGDPLQAPVRAPWPATVVLSDSGVATCRLRQIQQGQAVPELVKGWIVDQGPAAHRRQEHVHRALVANVAKDRRTGAAAEGQLFVNRAVSTAWPVPGAPGGSGDGGWQRARFHARVSVPQGAEAALRAVLPRVRFLGKSISRGLGRVRVVELPTGVASTPVEATGWKARLEEYSPSPAAPVEVPITLVTETLLLDAAGWTDGAPPAVGSNLRGAYSTAWSKALGVEVEVALVAATHRLRGGATARGPAALPPLVTTLPGSTFLLRFHESDLQAVVDKLAPIADEGVERRDLLDAAEARWRRMVPYQRSNGYGQVVILHPIHVEPRTDR